MCRRHCDKENLLLLWIDTIFHPICPRLHGQLHTSEATDFFTNTTLIIAPSKTRFQISEIRTRLLSSRSTAYFPRNVDLYLQQLHWALSPPQIRVKNQYICILPSRWMPENCIRTKYPFIHAVINCIIRVRFHKKRRPEKLDCGIIIL